jgi:GNAT superfamily N-acetyltransferase
LNNPPYWSAVDTDGFAHYEPEATGQYDPDAFSVRLGHPSDVPQCLEILATIQRSTAGWERTLIRTAIDGSDQRALFVAVAESNVVGYGRAVHVDQPTMPMAGWYLLGVVTDEAWRRRGIGRALTSTRLHWIAERASVAYCTIHRLNRTSIALHRQLGFVPVHAADDRRDDQILFRVDLRDSPPRID